MNPLEIARQIAELTAENSRGADALYEAEIRLAEAENELDLVESRAFLKAEGAVAVREALARLESAEARLQRDLRKAEANRIRVKIKGLETAIMASATQAKLIASELKV